MMPLSADMLQIEVSARPVAGRDNGLPHGGQAQHCGCFRLFVQARRWRRTQSAAVASGGKGRCVHGGGCLLLACRMVHGGRCSDVPALIVQPPSAGRHDRTCLQSD